MDHHEAFVNEVCFCLIDEAGETVCEGGDGCGEDRGFDMMRRFDLLLRYNCGCLRGARVL